MKKRTIQIVTILAILCSSQIIKAQQTDSLTDKRDGKSYKTVVIGNQIWMSENLNFDAGEGSLCYEDKASNCEVYGRLYDYKTAEKSCPEGWHLPNADEWDVLIEGLGGKYEAGAKMKATTTKYWKKPNAGATNSSGFSALPGGSFLITFYDYIKKSGYWWCYSVSDIRKAPGLVINYDQEYIGVNMEYKESCFSVRCVKNE